MGSEGYTLSGSNAQIRNPGGKKLCAADIKSIFVNFKNLRKVFTLLYTLNGTRSKTQKNSNLRIN